MKYAKNILETIGNTPLVKLNKVLGEDFPALVLAKVETFNLGTGTGSSVLEVIKAFEKASGQNIPYKLVPRRAGDIAICYSNPQKSKEILNWEAKHSLEDMCKSSWNWQNKNPKGYGK